MVQKTSGQQFEQTLADLKWRHRAIPSPAGPNLEPSHIYHFKGLVARCSTFSGVGTDHNGNRIPFGSPTTDFGPEIFCLLRHHGCVSRERMVDSFASSSQLQDL